MYLGRVTGNLHATVKNAELTGQRMLVVQPVDSDDSPAGNVLVCLDWAGAREGDLIFWCRGREASFPFLPDVVPADACIVAIVDHLDVETTPC